MKTNIPLLPVAVSVAVFLVSCTSKTTIIWNEGVPAPDTGVAVHELLVCNAPEGVDWDLWGHFYNAHKLPCRTVEGTMAQMYQFSGSCWRVEPEVSGDTIVLRYVDRRYKHSYAPHGFYLKMRKGGNAIPVPVKHNFQPCESAVRQEYPMAELSYTDITPAVKSVKAGEEVSRIESIDESIVKGMRPEGYRLTVGNGKALIEASDAQGFRYGRITLEKFIENAGSDTLQNMVVEDWPDFGYRAQMIDVARLFYPLDELKKLVTVMERSKMNVLALHLNDDEGWRLEIEGLPELTAYGAFHDVPSRQEDGSYICEKGIHLFNGGPIGGVSGGASGYYPREDFIDFLKYAWSHGVTVIPELDIPGHCYSAVEAMKYRERTTGDTSCRLIDPEDTSAYQSLQGYYGNVIDLALPSVFTFLGKVFDSIVSMYEQAGVPLNEIAVGGDEVAEGAWKGSPACLAAMKAKGFTDLEQLRGEFFRKVNVMLRDRGVHISGYHELLQGMDEDVSAEIVSNLGRIITWLPLKYRAHTSMAYDLANKGIKVVLAQGCHLYFDNSRSKAWNDRGLTWAGTLDEKKAFTFLPFNLSASNRFDDNGDPADLTLLKPYVSDLQSPENIVGMQPMIWGSNIWNTDDAFALLFPRVYGAWERSWNACPSWEQSDDPEDPAFMEDFIRFYTVVRQRELPHLDKVGLKYWASKQVL